MIRPTYFVSMVKGSLEFIATSLYSPFSLNATKASKILLMTFQPVFVISENANPT